MEPSSQVAEEPSSDHSTQLPESAPAKRWQRVKRLLKILGWEVLLCIKDVLLALGLLALLEALNLVHHRATFDGVVLHGQVDVLIPLFALAVPCIYLSLLIHEGRHFLAGWAVDFWFHSCSIRTFTIQRTRQGLQFKVGPRARSGGAVIFFPTGDRSLRLRQGLFVAGGPLASLLLAVLAWLLALDDAACCTSITPANLFDIDALLRAADSASPGGRLLIWILLVVAANAFLLFIWPLFPVQWKWIESDGWLLCLLMLGGPAVDARLLLSAIRGYSLRRIRPREWPADLASQAVIMAGGTGFEHLACLYAYTWAHDSGIASAGILLDRAIATCATPALPPPSLALEAAYFEARHRSNVAAARARLAQGMGRGSEREQVLVARAEAAILLAEEYAQQAEARARAGLAELLASQTGDSAAPLPMEAEHLRELVAQAQRQQKAEADAAPKSAMDT